MRRSSVRAFSLTVFVATASCGSTEHGARAVGTEQVSDAAVPRDDGAPPVPPPADAGVDAEGAAEACTPRDTDSPPKIASYSVKLAGHDAWIHDEKSPAGYFHTYDALAVGAGAQATPRKVHVFLPRSYAGGCKRYPVVYMNDGDTAFFAGSVGKSWDVQSVLATGYAEGAFGEMIVVAVHPLERAREYTHAQWLADSPCCGVAAYVSYLASALKPFVDGAYRTRAGASDTVIAGSSHGGLAAFYTASTRPDVFGKAIAMSSSFWVGLDDRVTMTVGGPLSSSALMLAAGPGLTSLKPRLYLDWGLVRTGGTHNSVTEELATSRGREMSALLVSTYGYVLGKSLVTVEDPLGEHDELSWKRRFGKALELAFAP